MKVKFKRLHPDAVIPKYARPGDAGLDLVATNRKLFTDVDELEANYIEYDTGLAVEIPEGFVGLVFPRSSISKKDLTLCNSVGVIDSGYRGAIKLRFKIDATYDNVKLRKDYALCIDNYYEFRQYVYNTGDRVGQLVIVPIPSIITKEVDELSDTERSEGGFGSTGK